ncbi:hypothetical protein SARC_12205 [Sphaeroforma arctica JP610]|uniref:Alginate lyase domain-containing protein n=1 Tax=Sphaeroforma arctica JP610 TaxID=667725 RepID=A0A0L0FES2_9EUKA|nr:hypothetical protein SARC_12205 [Sphaeroforma arctica JP610]KNC75267.1 hypothetical protein SARC_12205 [Sphaeroforma arctica JP610]|eukprot:XP_014149169.1 hypothetical protein SARC_12205 [Sphaeroforma arctica JP610]
MAVNLFKVSVLTTLYISIGVKYTDSSPTEPRTLLIDGPSLMYLRSHPNEIKDAISSIIGRAQKWQGKTIDTVLNKGSGANQWPGSSINDYYTFSPYYWLAEEAPCLNENLCLLAEFTDDDFTHHELLQLPGYRKTLTNTQYRRLSKDFDPVSGLECYKKGQYAKCDGMANGHTNNPNDKQAKNNMLQAVLSSSLSYWYTGDEKYAKVASDWARAWFVNQKTRMNPNTNFAQGITGLIPGQKYGIIEVNRFIQDVFEMLELLTAGGRKH